MDIAFLLYLWRRLSVDLIVSRTDAYFLKIFLFKVFSMIYTVSLFWKVQFYVLCSYQVTKLLSVAVYEE